MTRDLSELRESYTVGELRRADLADDPVEQFERWWDEWRSVARYDAAACVLATADGDGRPSARFVLCRHVDADGFVIYTNLEGRKARDLSANPHAAVTFGWLEMDRQVRVEGPVTPVDEETADAYWATRPRGSQLGAWASDQSEVVEDRAELERHLAEATKRFGADEGATPVPRPPFWGGYRVSISTIEFWQGRPDRVHDRFRYQRRQLGGPWSIDRLCP